MDALGALEPDWDLCSSPGGPECLELLRRESFDAVVAELALPVIDGARILDEVMLRNPKTLRFVVSDMTDKHSIIKCLGTAHQFLSKPCDGATLQCALRRAFTLDIWLPNENVTRLLAEMPKLPSPPALYFEVVKELRSEGASLESVGAIIERDPAMTAKILQMVNSAVFSLQRTVASANEAVLYLGVETTKSLILLAHTYSYFDQMGELGLSIDELYRHSVATSRNARWIAEAENASSRVADEAFTAGILHDIGKLALAANYLPAYHRAALLMKQNLVTWWEAEQEVFGANHAEISACMAAIWGLPITIVEALALHHHPTRMVSNQFCPLTAVHVANAFEHADAERLETPVVDMHYLVELELADRLPAWRQHCTVMRDRGA